MRYSWEFTPMFAIFLRCERQLLGRGRVSINFLDAGLCVVFVLFTVRGLLRGMLRELAGLVGLFLGFILAGRFYPQLAPHLGSVISSPNIASTVAYALIFIGTMILVSLVAVLLHRFMTMTFTGWLDHLLGGAVGAAKGFFLCAVALAIMERLVPESPFLTESALAPHVAKATTLVRGYLPAFL